ncbi:MAG: hypothetical protein ABW116_07340 [Candidatus Sedimenticola sp. 20ELBAFRAG]
MKIYIYAESDDLEAIAEPMSEALERWVKKSESNVSLVNERHQPDEDETGEPFWNLGVNLEAKRRSDLKKTLEFLYGLAREYKCEFVVGLGSSDKGPAQDICFFGHEEGKPDAYEIANYMGFRL